jgi:CBS domain-containing protein
MTVQSIMTSSPAACTLQSNLAEAARIMWERDCGIVPVTEDGKVIGVVTDRDICIAASTKNRPPSQIAVGELPRGDVIVCRQGDDVQTALTLMRDRRIRRLPVIGPDDRLAGVVSLNDLVLAAADKADVRPGDVVDVMKAICSHRARRAPATKAASA